MNDKIFVFNGRKTVSLENVKFAFGTHFGANNPDAYGNTGKASIFLTPEQAAMLSAEGINVRTREPRPDHPDDSVLYIADIRVNFESKWPPKVILVTEGTNTQVQLDGNSIGVIDNAYIISVDIVANISVNQKRGTAALYVDAMYCVQDVSNDPFAAKYNSGYQSC